MLAADTDLQGGPNATACLHSENDQLADPFLIEDLKGIVG
jgi:hypothetical protein